MTSGTLTELSESSASTPDFTEQPYVINGASDLLVELFGEKGRHSRCAMSVNSLPLNICVEVELIAEVEQ
ncbi:RidA family protein [Cloacibacillus porcorum]